MDVATHGVCGTQDIGVESFESPYLGLLELISGKLFISISLSERQAIYM
jgi:hypothetical protein